MNADQLARATRALDAWHDDGSPRAGSRAYDQQELESMHAALEAPATDAALEAFPGPPGDTTPQQDARNRQTMTELRAKPPPPSPRPGASSRRAAAAAISP